MSVSPRMQQLYKIALTTESPGVAATNPPDVDFYESDGAVLFSALVSLVQEYSMVSGMTEPDVLDEVAEIIGLAGDLRGNPPSGLDD